MISSEKSVCEDKKSLGNAAPLDSPSAPNEAKLNR